jgi:hypothetical protein
MGVRGGLGVNAFRKLHLNIKSNLPSPFCSSALAERDELCQCAPGEGKGADEAHRVTWEQAGMVQGTDLRMTCTFSEDPGQEREQVEVWQLGNRRLRVLSGLCTRELNDLWSGHPVFWPDLWCSFLMMSGGHHVTLALPPCIAWATEQETMSAQIPRLLLSRQRSLRLAVISILLVGRPTDFRKGSAAALPHDLSKPGERAFVPEKNRARRQRTRA